MTVKQVAASEQVSERQIQRYIAQGYKGCKLPAVRVGRSFQIAEADYKAWRVACGFDTTEALPQVSASEPDSGAHPAPASKPESGPHPAPCAAYPPYPLPADPNGVLTNVPHEHSSNWPHPLACQEYMEEQARKMKAQLRGYDDE